MLKVIMNPVNVALLTVSFNLGAVAPATVRRTNIT